MHAGHGSGLGAGAAGIGEVGGAEQHGVAHRLREGDVVVERERQPLVALLEPSLGLKAQASSSTKKGSPRCGREACGRSWGDGAVPSTLSARSAVPVSSGGRA